MKGLMTDQTIKHPHAAHGLPPRILVVDDDEDMRELIRIHLHGAGYDVVLAEDAVEAGHKVTERLPDLIIADYKMPYMNGRDFIAALRADATIPDLPVIFITAMENVSECAGQTFGFPLLAKPFRADELLEHVKAGLKLT